MRQGIIRLCAVMGIFMLAGPARAVEDPVAALQGLYATMNSETFEDPSDIGEVSMALTRQWFTPRFIALRQADIECWKKGKEGIGAIWFEGQDVEPKQLAVTRVSSDADAQTVRVTFVSFGERQTAEFRFTRQKGTWLIDDVISGGESLAGLMEQGCPE